MKQNLLTPTQRLGLALFLLGLGVFIATLSMSHYTLTDAILKQYLKPEHYALIAPKVQPMIGRTYTSKFGFIGDYQTVVEEINEGFRSKQEWNKVIYDSGVFGITKAASAGILTDRLGLWFLLSFGVGLVGALLYIWPRMHELPGIKNHHIFRRANTNRGWIGWIIGTGLIAFYVVLYFYPEYLTNWVLLVDPISRALNGSPASQWFLYGLLYTLVILVMGLRMLIKYRHSRYQQIRTLSVMFFQTSFAFLIPEILVLLNQPYQDLKNIWPLDYQFFFDYRIDEKIRAGGFGIFMLVWGIALALVGVPVFTYFFGKRWYCSWVCGCGGLAETLGDPYRQLSDKRLVAWKIERYLVHGVLVFAVVMTAAVLYTYFTGSSTFLGVESYTLRSSYGFWIGSIFAGVVGTGFYPLMGNRVWCRFGCPLAAYLGLVQRFKSRFRITTNGGQCISCGNCSTYCEMGIDVRWYAQRGQDIVRSSCVGCGVCSSVCPRGVLNLENADPKTRRMNVENAPILVGNDGVRLGV
jgi:polyferredoxin